MGSGNTGRQRRLGMAALTLLISACSQGASRSAMPLFTPQLPTAKAAPTVVKLTKPALDADRATQNTELDTTDSAALAQPMAQQSMSQAFSIESADVAQMEAASASYDQRSGLEIRSPAAGAVAHTNPLIVDLRLGKQRRNAEALVVRLDGQDVAAWLQKGALKDQWQAFLPDLAPGAHTLTVSDTETGNTLTQVAFQYRTTRPIERVRDLADATVRRFTISEMKWDWHEGLLLYALARLDNQLGERRYEPFIRAYYAHHIQKGVPKINWSDRCVPALAALELYKRQTDPAFQAIGQRVVDYVKSAKPTPAGGLNHMGTHPNSWVYPESMWVDSLMMYNVFAARWGQTFHDPDLTEFAAEQPLHFVKALQNPSTGLWKHAYLTTFKRPIPKGDVYWLRGNGWAIASMAELLDVLPAGHAKRAELTAAFQSQAQGLLPYQDRGGLWSTVLNRPGKTYLETSGSALCAYGMMKGAKQGSLPATFREPGEKAFLAVLDRLEQGSDGNGLSMPEISHNTMPYSFLGYSLVPQRNDLGYGLGALILAGIAYDEGTNS